MPSFTSTALRVAAAEVAGKGLAGSNTLQENVRPSAIDRSAAVATGARLPVTSALHHHRQAGGLRACMNRQPNPFSRVSSFSRTGTGIQLAPEFTAWPCMSNLGSMLQQLCHAGSTTKHVGSSPTVRFFLPTSK